MMPLWMTATLPLTSVCGCALRSVGAAVGGPAGVAHAGRPVQRDLAGVDVVLEIGQHAGLLGGVQPARHRRGRDPGGVVPAVLQPAQPFQDEGQRLTGTGVSDDAAHGLKANGCNAGLRHPQLIRVAPGGSPVTPLTAGGEKRIVRAAQRTFRGAARSGLDRPATPGHRGLGRHDTHRRVGLRSRVAGPILRRRRGDGPDVGPGPQRAICSACVTDNGTVLSISCSRSSRVSARRSLNASKQAAITTCSISAPEKPSVWRDQGGEQLVGQRQSTRAPDRP